MPFEPQVSDILAVLEEVFGATPCILRGVIIIPPSDSETFAGANGNGLCGPPAASACYAQEHSFAIVVVFIHLI